MLIIWCLVLPFHRFPFMGQSVTGTQTGDGQTLLPQAVTQVLLLVTSRLRMHVFLCLSLFFMVRPLPKNSRSPRTLPGCTSIIGSVEIKTFYYFLRERQSLKIDNFWKGSIYLRVEGHLEGSQMLRVWGFAFIYFQLHRDIFMSCILEFIHYI